MISRLQYQFYEKSYKNDTSCVTKVDLAHSYWNDGKISFYASNLHLSIDSSYDMTPTRLSL